MENYSEEYVGFKYHLPRQNHWLYKLSSYCQQLEQVYWHRTNELDEQLWSSLMLYERRFYEVWWEHTLQYDTVKHVLSTGKFERDERTQRYLLVNAKDTLPDANQVTFLGRLIVSEVYNQCKALYNGPRTYFKSKKVLLRMMKNFVNCTDYEWFENWEWTFINHVKPILGELEKLHYRRDDYYYY